MTSAAVDLAAGGTCSGWGADTLAMLQPWRTLYCVLRRERMASSGSCTPALQLSVDEGAGLHCPVQPAFLLCGCMGWGTGWGVGCAGCSWAVGGPSWSWCTDACLAASQGRAHDWLRYAQLLCLLGRQHVGGDSSGLQALQARVQYSVVAMLHALSSFVGRLQATGAPCQCRALPERLPACAAAAAAAAAHDDVSEPWRARHSMQGAGAMTAEHVHASPWDQPPLGRQGWCSDACQRSAGGAAQAPCSQASQSRAKHTRSSSGPDVHRRTSTSASGASW